MFWFEGGFCFCIFIKSDALESSRQKGQFSREFNEQ